MSTVFHPPWLSNIPLSDAPKLEKAMHADLTPLEFDPEEGYAEFSSKHAHYQTTLSSCVCGEHPCGGGFPCKHMYRLAMMMGLLPVEYENDPYKIKYPRNGISLPEAIVRLEMVSPAAQRYLLKHIQSLRGQASTKQKRTKSGNGVGTVYKRGTRWVAEVTKEYKVINGRKKRVSLKKGGFRTKKEALEYIPTLKGQKIREKEITWQQLYELWFPTHRAGKSTMDCYKAAYHYFSPLEFWKLQEIEIDDLQDCLDDCPRGKRTRENMKALCGLMYKYAIPRGYASLNLAQYLVVSGEHKEERSSFSLDQLAMIEGGIGSVPYADYIYCMCYLGFRPSEFLTLDVKDYDRVEKTLTGGAKTDAGKNRVVTISPKIQPIIDRLTKDRIAGALFCTAEGDFWEYKKFRNTAFYPALDGIGIKNPIVDRRHTYSPHTCRHTFATLMKSIPAPEKDKMKLIGHASPDMLRYYQDVTIEDLKKITDAL